MNFIVNELEVLFLSYKFECFNEIICDLMIRNLRGSEPPPVQNHMLNIWPLTKKKTNTLTDDPKISKMVISTLECQN